MTEVESLIADLDEALALSGQDVVLRRGVGALPQTPVDVTCRAMLAGYQPSQQFGEIMQQDQQFILSPSEIDAASWPGYTAAGVDTRIPILNDEIITTRGPMRVQVAKGFYVQDVLVRIEGRARGQ